MAEPYRTPTPLSQKSWEKKSPGEVGDEFAAREVTDVFRTIAAHGGGAASFDLALDLVLNQVVEQARLATGATGAAIALERAGEMVCRASSGEDAPELGVRLDTTSGLSGACLQTGSIQRCSDTENDPRVNAEDCRRLGLRSIAMLPLEDGGERFGILQAFSSWPNAFSDRDVNTLQALARRVVENVVENKRQAEAGTVAAGVASLEVTVAAPAPDLGGPSNSNSRPRERVRAVDAGNPADERTPGGAEVGSIPEISGGAFSERSAERSARTSLWTSVLGLLVIVVAVMLGLAMGWRAGLGRGLRRSPATVESSANQGGAAAARSETAPAVVADESTAEDGAESPTKASSAGSAVEPPSGGLLVTENGRVIYRLPAAGNGAAPGATSKKSEASATRLIHRVEPEYPAEASAKNIQGVVTLEVQIGTDGAVHNIIVVNGEAQLAEAAVQAVRQWRYQPYVVNGRPVEMESRVTIRFTRPTG